MLRLGVVFSDALGVGKPRYGPHQPGVPLYVSISFLILLLTAT